MMFVNSIKLFGSNWSKTLKFLLYYIVIWGICFALFLPVFFEFKDLVVANVQSANTLDSFNGVFKGALGTNLHNIIHTSFLICVDAFNANLGLAIYGLVVVFVFYHFLSTLANMLWMKCCILTWQAKPRLDFLVLWLRGLKDL